jgi:hypothetical protein
MFSFLQRFFLKYFYKPKVIIDDSSYDISSISSISLEQNYSDIFLSYDDDDEDEDEEIIYEENFEKKKNIKSIIDFAKHSLKTRTISECRQEIIINFDVNELEYIDANYIDSITLGKGGFFWVKDFNYPRENKHIKNMIAVNVGLFTFDLVPNST